MDVSMYGNAAVSLHHTCVSSICPALMVRSESSRKMEVDDARVNLRQ